MIIVLRSVLSIFLAAGAILFALANRGDVAVVYSPVHESIIIPVFILGLGAMFAGFLIGAVIVWMNGSEIRKKYRIQSRAMKKMERGLKDAVDSNDVNDDCPELIAGEVTKG
jgi:hypothetical protein